MLDRPQEGFAHIMYTAHMDDLPILIVLIMKNSFYSERYSGDPVHSILFNNVKVILKHTRKPFPTRNHLVL